jgi:hypothetical protein
MSNEGNQAPIPAIQRRKIYRIGRAEFLQVWPLLIVALVLILFTYGICLYESLFQLPVLAPVK